MADIVIDIPTIKNLTGATDKVAAIWLPLFREMLPQHDINTKERLAGFLSQLGHESGGLLYTREIADGSAYEGRRDLGNIQVGDGKKFKGRGLIQITGRKNYEAFRDKYGIDVVSNPDLLGGQYATNSTPEQLRNSLLASIWFWNKAKLNNLADKFDLQKPIVEVSNADTIKQITKIINGGINGLADRMNKFEAGRNYIKNLVVFINEKKTKVANYTKKHWLPITLIGVGTLGIILFAVFAGKKQKVTV